MTGLLLAAVLSADTWTYPLTAASAGDGRLVVADRNGHALWQVSEGEVSLLKQGPEQFNEPLNAVRCVAVGPGGRVYAGCSGARDVFRLEEDGSLTGLTGGQIGIPMDLAFSEDGKLYASDLELHRVMEVPLEGGKPVDVAAVRAPRGIAWDNGSLLVITAGDHALVRVTVAGSDAGKVEPVVKEQPFEFPHDVARLGETLYVTDGYADAVVPVDATGEPGTPLQADGMTNPVGILAEGEKLIVVDPRTPGLYELDADGLRAMELKQ